MTTKVRRYRIDIRGIPVEVVRKDIKNLYIGVYPPSGRVRVAAPLRLDDDPVRLAVILRLGWIRRKRAEFAKQARQSRREFVTGESHYFRGRRYRLDVIERDGPPAVRLLRNTKMSLQVRPGTDRDAKEAILERWYRRQLRDQLPELCGKWARKINVTVDEVRIKKMKTLWGSCNIEAKRIWLNLELAKKPPACLEYILVHEMVHFLERHHNERFRELMDVLMPTWRSVKDTLNQAPLSHKDWRY